MLCTVSLRVNKLYKWGWQIVQPPTCKCDIREHAVSFMCILWPIGQRKELFTMCEDCTHSHMNMKSDWWIWQTAYAYTAFVKSRGPCVWLPINHVTDFLLCLRPFIPSLCDKVNTSEGSDIVSNRTVGIRMKQAVEIERTEWFNGDEEKGENILLKILRPQVQHLCVGQRTQIWRTSWCEIWLQDHLLSHMGWKPRVICLSALHLFARCWLATCIPVMVLWWAAWLLIDEKLKAAFTWQACYSLLNAR